MPALLKKKNDSVNTMAHLDKIRAEITTKEEQLKTVQHAPVSKEEAFTKLDRAIERARQHFEDRYFRQWSYLSSETRTDLDMDIPQEWVIPFECWLDPQKIRDRLQSVIDARLEKFPGIGQAERTAQTTEFEAALWSLQQREEEEIMRLEGAGLYPARRAEANPRVVFEVVED